MPRSKKPYDFSFKVAFAGNVGVGKTALMVRFTKGTFTERLCTVGISNDSKIISIDDNSRVQVCKWRTLEQSRDVLIVLNLKVRFRLEVTVMKDIAKYRESVNRRQTSVGLNLQHWLGYIEVSYETQINTLHHD